MKNILTAVINYYKNDIEPQTNLSGQDKEDIGLDKDSASLASYNLSNSFNWNKSLEGPEFWRYVYSRLAWYAKQ